MAETKKPTATSNDEAAPVARAPRIVLIDLLHTPNGTNRFHAGQKVNCFVIAGTKAAPEVCGLHGGKWTEEKNVTLIVREGIARVGKYRCELA